MRRLSSGSSLLAGVFAVVLAASVGSGAFAQTAVEYTYSEAFDTWANGEERTGPSSDIRAAREGDHLTLTKGTVILRHNSRSKRIGVLRSGTSGSGRLILQLGRFASDLTGRIGEIKKQGPQAVDLFVWNAAGEKRVAEVIVARDAVVNNLSIDATPDPKASYPISSSRARVVFGGDLTIEGGAILNDGGANKRAYLVFNGSANQRISGTGTARITAAADGEGTIQVLNGVNNDKSKTATFDIGIGSNDKRLRQLTVGDSDKGGNAIFNRDVHVDRIDVIAGDRWDEDAVVEFRGDVSGGAMRLEESVGRHGVIVEATVIFNALGGDKTVGLTIDGASAGEGYLRIYDSDKGGSDTITFTGRIGGKLAGVSVGDGWSVGSAVFKSSVASYLNVTGGNAAGEASQATVEENLTAGVTLADNAGSATLTIGGAGRLATVIGEGQFIAGRISAGGDGQGTLIVDNRGDVTTFADNNRVVFFNQVGADGTALRQITLSDGRTIFQEGVYARSITIDTSDATVFKGDVKAETGIKLGASSGSVTFNGNSDQRISGTAKITTAADGEGTIQVLDSLYSLAPHKVTFDIEIGHDDATDANDRRLKQLTVGDSSKGGHAIFNKGVHVDHIDVIADNQRNERAIVEFRGDVSGDTIRLTSTGWSGAGAVFNALAGDITVDNEIVVSDDSAASVRIIGGRSGHRQHKVTFNGRIGSGGDPLPKLFVGGNAVFKEDVESYVLEVNGGHATVEKNLNFDISGTRVELSDYSGSATLTIGGAGRLPAVDDTGQTINGQITAGGDGQGTLIVDNRGNGITNPNNNKVTFTGQIGFDGTALRQITLKDGRTTFHKGVYADTITITTGDATVFRGDVKADTEIKLGDGSAVTFVNAPGTDAARQTITGNITSASGGNYGTIVIANTHAGGVSFKGSLGASGANNGLSRVTLNNNVKAAFAGNVYLENGLTFANGSRVAFNGTESQTIAGNITSASGGNYGTIIIANDDGVTFAGQLGASGTKLNSLTLEDNSSATFAGNVYLAGGLSLGDASTITFGGSGHQTIQADIRNSTGKRGSVVVNNSGGTVTFEDAVGATETGNDLARLTVSDGVAVFRGAVFAQGLEVSSTDGAEFRRNVTTGGISFGGNDAAQITLNGVVNQTVTGDIITDFDGRGLLVVNNTGDATGNTVTFTGRIGRGGNNGKVLQKITVSDGVAVFNGRVFAQGLGVSSTDGAEFRRNVTTGGISFAGNDDAKITLNGTANQTVTGDITTESDGRGLLVVNNAHATTNKVTFDGSVGADGRFLKQITLDDGQTTFHSGVYADTINITTGDATTFKGDVKAETGIKLGNNSGSVTFNGTSGQTVTGDITRAAGGNYGTITVANTDGVTFAGQLGASGQKLNRLTLRDGRTSFGGDVYAENIEVHSDDGTLFRGDVTGVLSFGGDEIEITFGGAGDQRVANAIAPGSDNRGLIRVNNSGGTVTFAHAVGASGGAVKQITLDNGQTVFEGAVYAGTIDVNADSDGTTFNRSVTTRAGLTLAGAATFKGAVTTGANGLVFDGAGGAATFAGTGAQGFANAITTTQDNQGAITIANRAGVTFEDDLGTDAAKLARLTLDTGTKATLEQSGYFAGNVTIGNRATLIVGDASGVTGTNGRGTGAMDAQTITGNIVAGDDGQGNLEIRNRSGHATGRKVSFTGSIGADGRALNRITVADGETTFNGDVYAGNLTITARDATTFRGHVKADREFELGNGSFVTFGGTAGQRITGDITSAAGGNYGTIIIANTHADGVTFGGQLGASGENNGLRSLTVNEGAKVTFTRPVYLSGTLRLKTGTTIALGDGLTRRDDATRAFVTVGDYAFDGDFTEANRVRLILPLSLTSGTQKVFSAHDTLDEEKFSFAGNNLVNYSYNFNDDGTDVSVKEKSPDVSVKEKSPDVSVKEKSPDVADKGDKSGGDGATDARAAVEYKYHSSRSDNWADGTERAENDTTSTDMAEARDGDHLTLNSGFVRLYSSSRRKRIGVLRSGTDGAGKLVVRLMGNGNDLVGRIGKIQKQGSRAVDLFVHNVGEAGDLTEVVVTGDAVVRNLIIFSQDSRDTKARNIFGGDLTIESGVNLNDYNTPGNDNTPGNGRTYLVFNGSADQMILGTGTAKITAAADGEGTIQVLNGRDGRAPNKATFDIKIGHDAATDRNDKRLRQLTVGDTSKGGHAIFNKAVHVDHIDVIGGNHTNERTTVEFRGDVSGETIKLTDGRHTKGDGSRGDGTDVAGKGKDADRDVPLNLKSGGDGSGGDDTDVKVADKDADKDASDEGNQGDGSGDTDVKVADKDADAGDEGNQGDGSGGDDTDVKVADKDADAGDEGNQGDGSGDTDVKVADKDADKDADAGDEGNQGDGSGGGDTDVKVADKDADKDADAGDEGNQGDGSGGGDTDVKVADKDADKDAGDEGNQGDGSGGDDTDVKVADKDADAGDEGNQGDGSGGGDTDVKVADKDADKDADAGDEGNQGDGSGGGDTDVKVADKDADAGDEGNQGDGSGGGDTDVKVADKDADAGDAGDEGNQGDGSGGDDTDVKVADKDADAGDEGNQGDGSGSDDTDVKVADKDADAGDAGDEGNQGDGSGGGDTDVAGKGADKDADVADDGNVGTSAVIVNAGAIFNASTGDIAVGNKITGGRSDGGSRGGNLTIIGGRSAGDPVRRNTVTFNNRVGASDGGLTGIFVGSNESAGIAVFRESINAGFIDISGGATADAASHVTIEKSSTSEHGGGGSITMGNNATLTIGGVGRSVTVNDTGQTINNRITAGGDGQGTLIVDNRGDANAGASRADNNKVTFGYSVGSDRDALKQITLSDGRTTFNKGVYAGSITIDTGDATVFRGDVKAETGFQLGATSGSVTFDGTTGQTVTGNITSAAGGDYGAIIIANTHADGVRFKGSLGASGNNNGLSRVTLNNTVSATFEGNVYLAGGLKLGDESAITFGGSGNQTIQAGIRNNTGKNNTGKQGFVFVNNSGTTHKTVTFEDAVGASGAGNDLAGLAVRDGVAVFRGDVFARVLLVESTDGAEFRGNVTTGALGISFAVNDEAKITLNGVVNQTVTGDITPDSDGRGRLVVHNAGHANDNTVTFTGRIGSTRNLRIVSVGDSGFAGSAVFKEDVNSRLFRVTGGDAAGGASQATVEKDLFAPVELRDNAGSATLTIGGAGRLAMVNDAGKRFSRSIVAGGDGQGTLIVDNRGDAGRGRPDNNKVTFIARIGSDSKALRQITLSDGRTTFSSDVYADTINITTGDATVFKGDVKADTGIKLGNNSGSVTFDGTAGQTVTGNITTDAHNQGSIIIANTHADGVSFKGALGTNSAKLANLTLRGNATAANASRAAFAGNVYLNGNLTLGENTRVTLNGSGDQEISATITNGGTAGRGDIVVNNSGGTVTFANAVGGSGGALKQITLDDGQTVFEGAVYAGTITVNSADVTTFNGAVSATAFKFGASATANSRVTFGGSTAQTITPAITTDANNQGAITIANRAGVTFEGNLGTDAARLARLTLDTGTKATLEQSGYFAGNVTIGNRATLIVGDASGVTGTNGRGTGVRDAQTITGNIVAGDDGQGNLEIRNRSRRATGRKVSFTGSIGADGRALNRITVADGETTFNGDVYAGNLTITALERTTFKGNVKTRFELGDGSFVTFGGTAGQRITGDITSASGGNYGTIIIANTHADGVTFGGQLGASGANNGLRSLTVNEGAKVTFTRPVYLSGTLRLKTGTTIALGDGLTRRDDATQAFVTVGDYAFDGDFTEANRVRLILPLSLTSGTQKVFSAHDTLDKEKFSFAGNNLVNYSYDFDDDGTDVTVTVSPDPSP